LILRVEPAGTDQRQKRVAGFQPFVQRLTKIAAERDAVDIEENRVLADISRQLQRQGSRLTF